MVVAEVSEEAAVVVVLSEEAVVSLSAVLPEVVGSVPVVSVSDEVVITGSVDVVGFAVEVVWEGTSCASSFAIYMVFTSSVPGFFSVIVMLLIVILPLSGTFEL